MEDIMDLYACQRKAEKEGYNKATFDLICPAGIKACQWLDAYFGLFKVDGVDGFLRVNDIAEKMPDVRCINFKLPDAKAA